MQQCCMYSTATVASIGIEVSAWVCNAACNAAVLHQWLPILWIKTTLNATTTPSKATAPWSFQQQLLKQACREYSCHLFYKMSCYTARRRSSINAPSLLNHIKFHLFQKGKHGSFALCMEPRDVTNEKASSFPAEAHPQHLPGVVEVARKSAALSYNQAQVGDTAEVQHCQCTVPFHL